VVPGIYEARLILTEPEEGSRTLSAKFEVRNDPRSGASQAELEDQLAAVLEIRDQISRLHEAVIRIRSLRKQLAQWQERSDLEDEARTAASGLEGKLHEIEDSLMVPGEHKDTFGLNQPARLSQKLASVIAVFTSADARPTKSAQEVAAKYTAAINEQLEKFDQVLGAELAEFNALMAEAGLPAVHA
jgi:DNA repair exonuclease SbcCD ATPase subunit